LRQARKNLDNNWKIKPGKTSHLCSNHLLESLKLNAKTSRKGRQTSNQQGTHAEDDALEIIANGNILANPPYSAFYKHSQHHTANVNRSQGVSQAAGRAGHRYRLPSGTEFPVGNHHHQQKSSPMVTPDTLHPVRMPKLSIVS